MLPKATELAVSRPFVRWRRQKPILCTAAMPDRGINHHRRTLKPRRNTYEAYSKL